MAYGFWHMDADILRAAGVDYEEGFRRFSGASAIYNQSLVQLSEHEVFAQIACVHPNECRKRLIPLVRRIKTISRDMGMYRAYEAACVLAALLTDDFFKDASVIEGYSQMMVFLHEAFSGIRDAAFFGIGNRNVPA